MGQIPRSIERISENFMQKHSSGFASWLIIGTLLFWKRLPVLPVFVDKKTTLFNTVQM